MKKILIITNNRKNRSPGQRFRFEQYLDHLEQNGYSIDFSFFISEEDDKYIYSYGNYLRKSLIILKNIFARFKNIINKNQYDIIFIFREATMLGTSLIEKWLSNGKAKLIFDFDDAIWLPNISDANKKLAWLKRPSKTSEIIAISDLVFAGNAYLAEYAKQFNPNVVIVPTTIDTEEYVPMNLPKPADVVTIGWSGSITTIQHFNYAINVLKTLKQKYQDKIAIKVIGDGNYRNQEINIKGQPWRIETELQDLCSFDIGIMPLPNDEWTKGKCGLKGLQYMSLEIPTIMSPVGVNSEIIQDGQNGFLADSDDEWVHKLSLLIENPELRKQLGQNARQTVEKYYSVNAWKDKYLQFFNQLIQK